jgi:hypothetical protein
VNTEVDSTASGLDQRGFRETVDAASCCADSDRIFSDAARSDCGASNIYSPCTDACTSTEAYELICFTLVLAAAPAPSGVG